MSVGKSIIAKYIVLLWSMHKNFSKMMNINGLYVLTVLWCGVYGVKFEFATTKKY